MSPSALEAGVCMKKPSGARAVTTLSTVVTIVPSKGLERPEPWMSKISTTGPDAVQPKSAMVLGAPGVMQTKAKSRLFWSLSKPSGRREIPRKSLPVAPLSSRPAPEPSV